jgi:hypothetical protein
MSWLDMIGFTIAVAAAAECIFGRLAQLDPRRHRLGVIAANAAMACGCILAASLAWQGVGVFALDMLSLIVAGHLVVTWDDWRHHPPAAAGRGADFPRGAVPSRIDRGDSSM